MRQNDALEKFIVKAKTKHGNNRFDYTITQETFISMNQNITIKCNQHDIKFVINPYNHLKNISGGCPTCKSTIPKSNANDIRDNSIKYFIETSKKKFGDLHYDYSLMETTFKGTKIPFNIRCLKHNEIVTIKGAANHVKTKYGGCSKCAIENTIVIGSVSTNMTLSTQIQPSNNDQEPATKKAKIIDNDAVQITPIVNDELNDEPLTQITSIVNDELNDEPLTQNVLVVCDNSNVPIQQSTDKKISEKEMIVILKEYKGECGKCTENKLCSSCNGILGRIRRNNFTHLCQWIVVKTGKKCGYLLKADEKTCQKHANLYDDKINNIRRCGRNGCQNILKQDEKYYCQNCKSQTNKETAEERNMKYDLKSKPRQNILPSYKRWLSGFFDGDGSIYIGKQEHPENPRASTQYTLFIHFTQKIRCVLEQILRYYPGGTIYTDVRCLTDESRNNRSIVYNLRYSGYKTEYILKDLLSYSIIKFKQLQIGLQYIECMKSNNFEISKEKYYSLLKELKQPCHEGKPYERLCYEYIAGLFDAEGCVHSSKGESYGVGIYVKITQKQDVGVLQALIDYYGYGKVTEYNYIIGDSVNIRRFLGSIYQYTQVKTEQIQAMFKMLVTIGKAKTNETEQIRVDANGALKIAKAPIKNIYELENIENDLMKNSNNIQIESETKINNKC